MYIVDDICYASELVEDIKIISVKPLQNRMMLVNFSTGETRLFDTAELEGNAFKILDDEEIFNKPRILDGVITWDNGNVDIAPETVYRKSYEYTTN